MPCTTWSTRNRATVFNKYSVKTLLVDSSAFCPCGPNYPDYSYRSRLFNPDPKYQGHWDHTCHMYDSIPKNRCCDPYLPPMAPGYPLNNMLPCNAAPNTGCWPEGDCYCEFDPCELRRCKRRRIRPPTCCCKPKRTYRQWIKQMKGAGNIMEETRKSCKCEAVIPPARIPCSCGR